MDKLYCWGQVISVGFDLDSAERKEILAEVAGADLRDKECVNYKKFPIYENTSYERRGDQTLVQREGRRSNL